MLSVLIENLSLRCKEIVLCTYGDQEMLMSMTSQYADRVKIVVYRVGKGSRVSDYVRLVAGAKFIVWGGGTCFMDEGGTGGVKYMLIARLVGTPVYYMGIGVDKCRKLKTKFTLVLASLLAKKVFFRDEASRKCFSKYAVKGESHLSFVPDLAFGAQFEEKTRKPEEVAVCLRDLTQYVNNPSNVLSSLLSHALEVCARSNVKDISIIVGDVEIDQDVSSTAEAFFRSHGLRCRLINGASVRNVVGAIAQAVYLLSIRLHPAVVAHCLGVPYGLYNYSDKNIKFLEYVGEDDRAINVQQYNYDKLLSRPSGIDSDRARREIVEKISTMFA